MRRAAKGGVVRGWRHGTGRDSGPVIGCEEGGRKRVGRIVTIIIDRNIRCIEDDERRGAGDGEGELVGVGESGGASGGRRRLFLRRAALRGRRKGRIHVLYKGVGGAVREEGNTGHGAGVHPSVERCCHLTRRAYVR